LDIIAGVEGEQALDLLTEAARDPNPELRAAALERAGRLEDTAVTDAFLALLEERNPVVQADIITMLGKHGTPSALNEIRYYLASDSQTVRLAALDASVALGGVEITGSLLAALDRATEQQEIEAVKTALLQLPSAPLFSAARERWMSLSTHSRVTLIGILAERRGRQYMGELLDQLYSFSPDVRLATFKALGSLGTPGDIEQFSGLLINARSEAETETLQRSIATVANSSSDKNAAAKPLVESLENASPEQMAALLETLAMIGGSASLEHITTLTDNSDIQVREAAFAALAQWPDVQAIPHILQVLAENDDDRKRQLLDGLIRLVRNSHYSDRDKVDFLTRAAGLTSSGEQQIMVLNALSGMPSTASLKAVSEFYTDENESVREQAYRAAAEIMAPFYRFSDDFDGADQTLSVLEATADSTTRQKIVQHIEEYRSQEEAAEGFSSLFNGRDLSGWTGVKNAYVVENGQLVHKAGASGNIFTEREYGDFILRFEFKLTPGANNGLAIRSPLEGDPAFRAMELQILDNQAEKYDDLAPWQYHGSIYGVVPAERGHLKPAGEWNRQEVVANGSRITVRLNGVTILDTDLQEIDPKNTPDGRDHPGLMRSSGHIGFLGHGDEVAFRNIQVRDLDVYYPDYSMGNDERGGMNHPPEGFTALFNGENLDGWNGLVANPEKRAEMSDRELAEAQENADRIMEQHWSVRDGILYFDGKGESLTTAKKYGDFEMLLDWKIEPGGDSGVYLRGTPQVQIWDITENPVGSGGLYNNQNHPSEPLVPADNPVGEWNRMRIKMVGERVTVHLNNRLVVDDVVMENYWNRDKPIYPEGQIELQAHNTPLYFKNVFIREIPRTETLFNGEDLTGWDVVDAAPGSWQASNGTLVTDATGGGWISTREMYDNFKLKLEYRLPEGGNSGIFIRAPRKGNPAYQGMEIQLLDDYAAEYSDLDPWQYTASIYGVKAPSTRATKPAGEWQEMTIEADGPRVKVWVNGEMVINTNLVNHMTKVNEHPGLKRRKGYIGLQNHDTKVEFRNIRITEIK
ncbi:MAG: family 16 glycoside hydrolase, partial [Balneolaceae bacterium]|nr:family 16 glycoside hydrolase [Balneolaceae bacterium]